jgi:hypothetical protein
VLWARLGAAVPQPTIAKKYWRSTQLKEHAATNPKNLSAHPDVQSQAWTISKDTFKTSF